MDSIFRDKKEIKRAAIDAAYLNIKNSHLPRIFLSGKIRSDVFYMEKFKSGEKTLKDFGYCVVNPAIEQYKEFSHKQYIDMSLNKLTFCNVMIKLDKGDSNGCFLEQAYCNAVGIPIVTLDDFINTTIDISIILYDAMHHEPTKLSIIEGMSLLLDRMKPYKDDEDGRR